MKKLLCVFVFMLSIACISGCSLLGGGKTQGKVSIVSGSETFQAVETSDGTVFDMNSSVMVPYSSDLVIQFEGQSYGNILYSVYDADGNLCYADKSQLEIPQSEGTYNCIIKLSWGDSENSKAKCYQFSIVR